jgi:hypothetical protein
MPSRSLKVRFDLSCLAELIILVNILVGSVRWHRSWPFRRWLCPTWPDGVQEIPSPNFTLRRWHKARTGSPTRTLLHSDEVEMDDEPFLQPSFLTVLWDS